ncbi:MAG: DUF3108 domain-containing protein, partial [Gammaproteobacteria bacterium]
MIRSRPTLTRRVALLAMTSAAIADAAMAQAPAQTQAAETLMPFTASFEVVYRGMNAGTTTLELSSEGGDRWRYVSRANARGVFRLVLSGEIRQTSLFTLGASGPRPIRYVADDGTEDIKRDIRLDFDWKAGRVRGTAEAQPVDLPVRDGLQDGMSAQIALMRALAAGERPRRFFLIDKDEVKEYVYEQEGTARIKT